MKSHVNVFICLIIGSYQRAYMEAGDPSKNAKETRKVKQKKRDEQDEQKNM